MVTFIHQFAGNRCRSALLFAALFAMFIHLAPPAAYAGSDDEVENKTVEQLCDENDETSWQYALNDAAAAHTAGAIAAGQNVYKNMKVRNLMQCILDIKSYFNKIQALLSSVAGAIGAAILHFLGEFFKMICDYIIKTIENLMQMVCVPVPNLGFSLKLDMPSLQSASCDGLSLADFISINGHGGTFPAGMPALSINNMSLGTELFRKRSQ